MTAPTGLANDGSTLALFQFNESTAASSATDQTGTYTCPVSGSPQIVSGMYYNGLLRDHARQCLASVPSYFVRAAADAALLTAFGAAQSVTFEALIYPYSGIGDASVQTIALYGTVGGGTSASNHQAGLYYDRTNKRVGFYHQHGANSSSNSLLVSATNAITPDAWNYVVGVRTWTGAAYNLTIYVNGVLSGTLNSATAPDGGGTTLRLSLGTTNGFTSQTFAGILGEVRLSSVARSAGNITAANTAYFPTAEAVPGTPTIGTATAGNAQATVTWSAPADTGGLTLQRYTVTSSPGGLTESVDGSTLSAVVSGLTNGTAYTFTVKAVNDAGLSSASAATGSVTPSTVPGAPTTIGTTVAGTTATVTWVAPASTGGSAITGYRVTTYPGGATTDVGVVLTGDVTGLTNGTAYDFTVSTLNANGYGAASVPGPIIKPGAVPGAPTSAAGTAGNASVAVTWAAPVSDGGSSISSYTVTSSPGGFTAQSTGTSATVYGLTNGTAYTFTVTATNASGTGSASSASAARTPSTVPGVPTSVVATAGDTTSGLTWIAPASTGGSAITGYRITKYPGGTTTDVGVMLSTTITGLTNGTAYSFTVSALNANGAGVASAAALSIDVTDPVVTIVSPAADSQIDNQTPLVVDVTDWDLGRAFLAMEMSVAGRTEVVHDGDSFAANYSKSTRVAVSNGYRYTILRSGKGWEENPRLRVFVADQFGNEA